MVLISGKSNHPNGESKPIYARSGWKIPQEIVVPLSMEKVRINAAQLKAWHPRATLRSVSNFPYNCVGMVFAARRTWIEIDYLPQILEHDGYSKINLNDAAVGDVVAYINNKNEYVHVGLLVVLDRLGATINIKMMSKWGLWISDLDFKQYSRSVLVQPSKGKRVGR